MTKCQKTGFWQQQYIFFRAVKSSTRCLYMCSTAWIWKQFSKALWFNSIVFVKNEYSGSQFSVTDSNGHGLKNGWASSPSDCWTRLQYHWQQYLHLSKKRLNANRVPVHLSAWHLCMVSIKLKEGKEWHRKGIKRRRRKKKTYCMQYSTIMSHFLNTLTVENYQLEREKYM